MTSGYNQVKAYKGAIDSTASAGATGMISNGTNVGTFTLKNNQKLVISGIPYGTEYIVTETVNTNATAAVSLDGGTATEYTSGDDKSGAINNSNGADVLHFKNERTREVSVKKTDKDNPSTNTGLGNALFDLFFKESITPTRYTVNDPTVAPNKKSSVHVDSSITAPAADTTETTIVNTNKTVAYSGDTPPSASDSEWIFPRNDTDYIYFRDFNSGSQGEHDTTAFGSSSKLAWRTVWFASMGSGTHNQYEELGFDESKWMAAEFSGPGKQTVRYAVWERFVDDSVGNRNTVVYKIQPPDGYTSVKFMLMEGDTPIRKTQSISFQLGRIYQKTNWGGYWTSTNGKNCYYDVPVTFSLWELVRLPWLTSATPPWRRQESMSLPTVRSFSTATANRYGTTYISSFLQVQMRMTVSTVRLSRAT